MKKYFIITALFLLSYSNLSAHSPGFFTIGQAPGKRGPHPLILLKKSSDELKSILKNKMPELGSILQKKALNVDKEIDKLKVVANNLITGGQNLLQKLKTEKIPEKAIEIFKSLVKELIELHTTIDAGNREKAQEVISKITNKIPLPLFLIQGILMKIRQIIPTILTKFHQVAPMLIIKFPAYKDLIQKLNKNIDALSAKAFDTLLVLINYASIVQLGSLFKRKFQEAQPAIMQKLKQTAPGLQQKLKEVRPTLQKKLQQGPPAWLKKLQKVVPPAQVKPRKKDPAKPIILPNPVTKKI